MSLISRSLCIYGTAQVKKKKIFFTTTVIVMCLISWDNMLQLCCMLKVRLVLLHVYSPTTKKVECIITATSLLLETNQKSALNCINMHDCYNSCVN